MEYLSDLPLVQCGYDSIDAIPLCSRDLSLLDRYYWVSLDPLNVAEGLFAITNIFSFSRIYFLLPAFQHLGPLQISLCHVMPVSVRQISLSNLFFRLGYRQIQSSAS